MPPSVSLVSEGFCAPNQDMEKMHWGAPHNLQLATSTKPIKWSMSGVGSELIAAFRTNEIILGPGPHIKLVQERSKGLDLSTQCVHTLCIASSAT